MAVGVRVTVGVRVAVAVLVGVSVSVATEVSVGGGVSVGVCVLLGVRVFVGVYVLLGVSVAVGVSEGVNATVVAVAASLLAVARWAASRITASAVAVALVSGTQPNSVATTLKRLHAKQRTSAAEHPSIKRRFQERFFGEGSGSVIRSVRMLAGGGGGNGRSLRSLGPRLLLNISSS